MSERGYMSLPGGGVDRPMRVGDVVVEFGSEDVGISARWEVVGYTYHGLHGANHVLKKQSGVDWCSCKESEQHKWCRVDGALTFSRMIALYLDGQSDDSLGVEGGKKQGDGFINQTRQYVAFRHGIEHRCQGCGDVVIDDGGFTDDGDFMCEDCMFYNITMEG